MATALKEENVNDTDVWQNVVDGDTQAFEQVVVSHQSAVSAVAFSIVGDFSTSQDIAQETFWAAWKSKDSLRDTSRLGAWLCGISRNLARQWRKRKQRANELDNQRFGTELESGSVDPADDFVSKEEESVVWKALEDIPENYREVLVLYYRKDKSIEEVATSLGLTNDAARQRLSRGREILRSHVSNMIEGVLDRTNPTRTFTARVMTGIASMNVVGHAGKASASTLSMTLNSTTATSAAGIAKLLATGSSAGLIGGLLGIMGGVIGLAGAWFGSWFPAQMAPTETERQLLMERIKAPMYMGVTYVVCLLAFVLYSLFNPGQSIVFIIGLFLITTAFVACVSIHSFKTQALVKVLRKELSAVEDPNLSTFGNKIKQKFGGLQQRYGRRYTSPVRILGLPLFDIQVSDPADPLGRNPKHEPKKARPAKGWIAIGDVATGFIALGGRTMGVISIGGFATGIVALGGLSLGIFSFGGMAIGWLALGGGAIGYDAVGGGALGWHSAAGGGAIAWHIAAGGGAIAHDFAVGGGATANEVNTVLAQTIANNESYIGLLKNQWISPITCVVAILCSIVPAFLARSMYTTTPSLD